MNRKTLIFLAISLIVICAYINSATALTQKLSESIGSIVIGPVANEYGYELKVIKDGRKALNAYYDNHDKAQIVGVIEKLKRDYPNLKRIGLVIGWYGDTTKAGKITIVPKANSNKGPEWEVAEYTRKTAIPLKHNLRGDRHWDGTPTDRSIVELAQMLNKHGFRVTIYPFIFIDNSAKPWRGLIRASKDEDIEHFFEEYNKFILHYATLEYNGVKLKDVIKGFLLGSELEALTKYRSAKTGQFLTTEKLVELAAKVRKVVGKGVSISYAANWAEYHSSDGWFHLDKLWQDKNINYVGIDAYFPLTSHVPYSKHIDVRDIEEGWESGEYYNYYEENGARKKLTPQYAIQNIKYWWTHNHVNPDGSKTGWRPKMKPIVFYEIGFTAISKTTNSPYSYVDKLRADLGLPKGSSAKIRQKYQYNAVLASLKFIERINEELDSKGIIAHKYWYNIDPKGRSSEWIYSHELKIAEFEKGEFTEDGKWKGGKKKGWLF
jgi:hypothetical protein